VFRTQDLSESDVWAIGQTISAQRNQTLHARGDLLTRDVTALDLAVEPAEPPPRHANIVSWPPDKSRIKLLAMKLAAKAALRLPH